MSDDTSGEDPLDESSEQAAPRYRGRDRVERFRHGPYYIAPDSAEPIPDAIWEKIDLGALASSVDRWRVKVKEEMDVNARQSPDTYLPTIFHVPSERRQFLTSVGGKRVTEMLDGLEQLNIASGGAATPSRPGAGRRRAA